MATNGWIRKTPNGYHNASDDPHKNQKIDQRKPKKSLTETYFQAFGILVFAHCCYRIKGTRGKVNKNELPKRRRDKTTADSAKTNKEFTTL